MYELSSLLNRPLILISALNCTVLTARSYQTVERQILSVLPSFPLFISPPATDIFQFSFSHLLSFLRYLANLTLESLQEMFTSAKDIMDWLGTCASLVASQVRKECSDVTVGFCGISIMKIGE